MPASAAEGSSSNSEGSYTTTPPQDLVVPLTASQDGEPNRTRDENGNWTGDAHHPIAAVAPVPAAPVAPVVPALAAAASEPTDAAQPNVSPAGVPSNNYPNRRVRMAERPEQQQGREQFQHPIAGNARLQFIMDRPPAFYANAIPQQPWTWPSPVPGSVREVECFRRAPLVLQSLPYLGYSTPVTVVSHLMSTVPIYSPSLPCCARSPPYPPPIQICPLNSCAGSRSSPYRFPRPNPREKQAVVAPPMHLKHVAPLAELPPPMCAVLLECPGALAQSAPNAPLFAMLPHGSVLQPTVAVSAVTMSGLGPSERSAGACSPDSTSPEVGQAGVNARPVSAPAARLSASGGNQRQATGVHGTAMHAPPRPAARSGPAAGTPPAAGSPAYAAHAAGAMTSTAGSWRMQDGAATGWTPTAAQQVAGPAMPQATVLAPSFVGSCLAITSPQPAPTGQQAGQQQCLLGCRTVPSQSWQHNLSPRHQLEQQQPMQPARRAQPNVETSSFGAAPAQVGHDPTSPATSQTEGEQQRPTGSSVSTPPQLQYDQNSLQPRRTSQTDSVAREASTSDGVEGALQRFPESGLGILDGSDALGVSLSVLELDVASDSEEAAYEPQHRNKPRTGSPTHQPSASLPRKY